MINKLFDAIKKGDFYWKFPKKIYLERTYNQKLFFIKNKAIKELQIEDKSYRKLEKEFGAFVKEYKVEKKECTINRTVWICWMQGENNAPEIVKACIQSIRNQLSNFKIVILTSDNISEYITLPPHIIKKYEKGIISNTHFSDILRVAILSQYGGLWLDSTVYCTNGDFAEKIITLPMFVYKVMNLDTNDVEPIVSSSWLISATSNNPILMLTRDILYKYWEKHNYLINFFLLHLCITLAARKFKEEWSNIPMYNNRSPHTLMFELQNKFNDDRWKEIKEISSFHKLTRHFKYDNKDTFYDYIVKRECL